MKKILVTGGAGFIGLFLSKHLAADPDTALVLVDNLQRGRMDDDLKEFLAANAGRATFITADLTDPKSFETLDRDFDHVYHLAAVNGTKWFYEMPQEVLRINTLSLTNVLAWITTLEKKPKLCFTSSNEAYAGALASFDQLPIPTPEDVPLVISDTYNPRWTYAATKLIGELFVIHYAKRYGFPALIVRPHNFYGPRAGYDHVIPEFCKRIQDRVDPFQVFGPDETRTFCYITDAVRAMQMLMDSPKTDGQPVETVHIGNTDEITMQGLADKLFAVTGWKPSRIDVKESPAGSVKRRLADISKIESMIGWRPEIPLEEGLKRTFDWYALHPKPANKDA
ncbi:MAG: NAD-dependent epimerase/dehydratase family protein [Patescibacteria group bacterium]